MLHQQANGATKSHFVCWGVKLINTVSKWGETKLSAIKPKQSYVVTEVFCLLEVMALWYSTSCGSLLLETLIIVFQYWSIGIYKFDTFIWNNIHLFVLIWNVVSTELYNVHYYVICMFLSAMRLVHRTENKLRTPKTWKKDTKEERNVWFLIGPLPLK